MDESGVRVGCPKGETVIVPTQVKELYTASPENRYWHILLLDSHITQHKDDFILKCHENHIVPIWFPSHLTHVLQPLDVAIHNALYCLDMEYNVVSFFHNLSSIREQTFQLLVIKNAFKNSSMFPVSYKGALKKMRYYNAKRDGKTKSALNPTIGLHTHTSTNHLYNSSTDNMQENDELELPVLPSTYFEYQTGIREWIEKVKTFSPTSKVKFQQWAKGIEIVLAESQLQQESYHAVESQIFGVITVEGARLRKNVKKQRQKVAAIKKARKDIQIAVNKAKAALYHHKIDA
ncbi:hypothetical protein L873DRAFT_1794319 [Choiromyces venosus 120613-1]|uniref:DDE-1 domain-containing protein n=1 Tax=Choiromyces venosus 120613-1 TaxID=1336337 RepID=A0A3N4JEV3_9PEZI|nr:hypothetical protein L873DRAFT_1794319 [Choiromyces venosus 120613-1]